ncbi:helix-turn-helix transcriptional regulator [Chitinophaga sp. NPDC101104]|uniref:helix-turn-helix transcriptional regulator n=1 Tax=Chitinophaga sp. NPDC101104 TaxID=3390561 RepID=UPI003D08A9D3
MNRIDRLTAILVQLQGKKIVKAQEIADRFDISLRTVYRDVKALMEAGVPIGAEAGTGYYIVDGYHLPPVMFDRSEAAALLTGEKLMEKHSDRSNHQQFSSAMQKIRAVLRGSDKDFLESLDENIAVLHDRRSNDEQEFPNRFLSDIQAGLANQKVLAVEYYSFYSDSTSHREIEPIGIFHMNSSWHLIGWCRLRNDYRDFRADRIKTLHLTNQGFDKSKRITLQQYITKEFEADPDQPSLIKVRISHDVARWLGQQKYHYGFVQEKMEENYVEMDFLYRSLSYFARWLLMLGKHAEIVEPDDLKIIIRQQISELSEHYS